MSWNADESRCSKYRWTYKQPGQSHGERDQGVKKLEISIGINVKAGAVHECGPPNVVGGSRAHARWGMGAGRRTKLRKP